MFNGGKNPYPGMSPYTVARMIDNGGRLQKPSNAACSEEMYGNNNTVVPKNELYHCMIHRFQIMMACWVEMPEERPSFSDIVKIIDNRMSAIAGYLDVSYNPFIHSCCDSSTSEEYHYCKAEELPLSTERKKPQIKPRTKKPIIHNRNEPESAVEVDDGQYY